MSRGFKLGVLAAAVMATAPAVQAFEAGDFILRAGVVHVAPDDSSDPLLVTGFGPLAGNRDLLAGTEVGVDANTQLGIRATYMFTNSFGLGILGATPFKHDIKGESSLAGAGKLGETKHLPPTITLQYFPMPSSSAFQPFVGVGVNYTTFFEEKTTDKLTGFVDSTANAAYGTPQGTVTSTKLDLDDSVGVAFEIGMDYMLSKNFGLNAAIWWADINTDATVSAFAGDTKVAEATTEVEIDPMVYMVGFTYKF
ncbi:OmpW/AlkL family protein [Marinobacter nauticus]|uniref:Outer membrane protein OmpW n=1 Tax=Marinobacter nauticus TaxID=2743 RepID=A0A1M2UU03_MARNT|nr:OmpW family outer membrane protein [Marinobacter nauticus]OJS98819.1 outer membrane protein OmpW [Marinobacter nauticus]